MPDLATILKGKVSQWKPSLPRTEIKWQVMAARCRSPNPVQVRHTNLAGWKKEGSIDRSRQLDCLNLRLNSKGWQNLATQFNFSFLYSPKAMHIRNSSKYEGLIPQKYIPYWDTYSTLVIIPTNWDHSWLWRNRSCPGVQKWNLTPSWPTTQFTD